MIAALLTAWLFLSLPLALGVGRAVRIRNVRGDR